MPELNLYRVIVPEAGEHPSNEWAEYQANPSSYYPAVVPWYDKPAGSKNPIKWSPEMLAWGRTLQIDDAAFRELLWVAGGVFNRQGNEPYIIKGKKSYIPTKGPWPQEPVGQPVTSVKNLVNVLEIRDLGARGRWARIETLPTTGPWTETPASHPWLFNKPFTSIRTGDNQTGNAIDSRGIIVPYFADGEAWIDMAWLEKYTSPIVQPPVITPPREEPMPTNTKLPKGKGLWYYQILPIQQLFGQSGLEMSGIRNDLIALKPDHVIVKTSQDTSKYNLRRLNPNVPVATHDDLLPAFCTTVRNLGIEVWAYAGIATYTRDNPIKAAQAIAARAKMLGAVGIIVNAEAAWKVGSNRYTSARAFMKELRKNFSGPILFSSYKYPVTAHPELPWREFLNPEYCDGIANQVYWVGQHNPVEQLERSMAEYRTLSQLPFVPAGSAYTEQRPDYRMPDGSLWQPTPADILAFATACKAKGFSGFNLWSRWDMRRVQLEDVFATIQWDADQQTPPPVIPDVITTGPKPTGAELRQKAYALCLQIESLGASPELTKTSIMASELLTGIQRYTA